MAGSTTVYFLLFSLVMLSLMVMAVDVGRFYVIQGELQTAADAAALAAATRLAGTMSSTDQANLQSNASFDSTTGNDNRFNLRLNQILFSANLVTQTTVSYFSSLAEAIGNTGGGDTGGIGIDWSSGIYPKYARVQISGQAPTLFAPFLNRSPGALPTIAVSAVAGLSGPMCTASGIDAFAVVDPSMGMDADNFGLIPGDFYTLYLTTTATTPPTPLNVTHQDIIVPYVVLDHYPNGLQDPGSVDDSLFELAASGFSNSPGLAVSGNIAIGSVEIAYGSPNAVVLSGSANAPSRDILCGLNVRFGADLSGDTNCNSNADFTALASQFIPDMDIAAGVYTADVGLQDFAMDYCQEGACNFRRVLTVPVMDAADTLNVLNFRQFLVDASSTAGAQGVDTSLMNGTFRAQYIGTPVPLRSGTLGGSCNVSSGVGRVVLH